MGKTLLLADDSLTIQKVVGITFAGEDVELVTVDNGDDALERARADCPALVLADVTMPGLNGYELCRAIQQDPALSGTPVLLLTGTFETFDGGRAREVGASGHITKPFEAQALIAQVNALIAKGRTPRRPVETDVTATAPQPAAAPMDVGGPAEPSSGSWSGSGAEISLEELEGRGTDPDQDFGFGDDLGADAGGPAIEEPDFESMGLDASPQDLSSSTTEPPELETLDPLGEDVPPEAGMAPLADDSMARTALFAPRDLAAAGEASGDEGPADLPWVDPVEAEPLAGETPELPEADALFEEPSFRPASAPSLGEELGDLGEEGPVVEAQPTMTGVAPFTDAMVVDEEPDARTGRSHPVSSPGSGRDSPVGPVVVDRDAVREMLEKIAWEAFSTLSEQVVQEVVKKVEAIAWEAIPTVAERLVREEIARLKDDDPSD
jgi:CheY-like chemotaxis protein